MFKGLKGKSRDDHALLEDSVEDMSLFPDIMPENTANVGSMLDAIRPSKPGESTKGEEEEKDPLPAPVKPKRPGFTKALSSRAFFSKTNSSRKLVDGGADNSDRKHIGELSSKPDPTAVKNSPTSTRNKFKSLVGKAVKLAKTTGLPTKDHDKDDDGDEGEAKTNEQDASEGDSEVEREAEESAPAVVDQSDGFAQLQVESHDSGAAGGKEDSQNLTETQHKGLTKERTGKSGRRTHRKKTADGDEIIGTKTSRSRRELAESREGRRSAAKRDGSNSSPGPGRATGQSSGTNTPLSRRRKAGIKGERGERAPRSTGIRAINLENDQPTFIPATEKQPSRRLSDNIEAVEKVPGRRLSEGAGLSENVEAVQKVPSRRLSGNNAVVEKIPSRRLSGEAPAVEKVPSRRLSDGLRSSVHNTSSARRVLGTKGDDLRTTVHTSTPSARHRVAASSSSSRRKVSSRRDSGPKSQGPGQEISPKPGRKDRTDPGSASTSPRQNSNHRRLPQGSHHNSPASRRRRIGTSNAPTDISKGLASVFAENNNGEAPTSDSVRVLPTLDIDGDTQANRSSEKLRIAPGRNSSNDSLVILEESTSDMSGVPSEPRATRKSRRPSRTALEGSRGADSEVSEDEDIIDRSSEHLNNYNGIKAELSASKMELSEAMERVRELQVHVAALEQQLANFEDGEDPSEG